MGGRYTADFWVYFHHSYTTYQAITSMDVNGGGGSNSMLLETNQTAFRVGITSYSTAGRVNWMYWQSIGW